MLRFRNRAIMAARTRHDVVELFGRLKVHEMSCKTSGRLLRSNDRNVRGRVHFAKCETRPASHTASVRPPSSCINLRLRHRVCRVRMARADGAAIGAWGEQRA
jgi:hypothetical protein